MEKITISKVIKVKFIVPVAGFPEETYFGSLSAIFEVFTPEQIGSTLQALWDAKINVGFPKKTHRAIISKHIVYRKQNNVARK